MVVGGECGLYLYWSEMGRNRLEGLEAAKCRMQGRLHGLFQRKKAHVFTKPSLRKPVYGNGYLV